MIILDIDKPERCDKCLMHNDGNDYCKLAHAHACFVRAKGCPIQTINIGHWIEHEIKDTCRWLTCSECGYEWINKKLNFCPNCGAKMEELNNE